MDSLSDKDDDWESLADSGLLDKRLKNLARNKSREQSLTTAMTTETRDYPINSQPAMTFKILKKTPGETSKMALNHQGAASHKNTPKDNRTFEQREEDYMKARMRIFGNPEDGNFGSNQTAGPTTGAAATHSPKTAVAQATPTTSNSPHGGSSLSSHNHASNSSCSNNSNGGPSRSSNQNAQYFNNRRKKQQHQSFDKQ